MSRPPFFALLNPNTGKTIVRIRIPLDFSRKEIHGEIKIPKQDHLMQQYYCLKSTFHLPQNPILYRYRITFVYNPYQANSLMLMEQKNCVVLSIQ
jgi:hypothetical protein